MVIRVPPSEKFSLMDGLFSRAAAPDPKKCPNVDKSYCETHSKINEAEKGVLSAAPKAKFEATFNVLFRQASGGFFNINKAYAIGDDKEIARVLAAYNKAADTVNAAAPAEKLKVFEETFAALNKAY
ncbi:hypothetical protein U9M48_005393 [Paspalum notatum var. saurae]|uniref:Uncharacterized protein n=1 Tax=Paspalum notatum var. saurae TaxID=547442 RepID=A0AAQ3PQR5_PASNO